MTLTLHLGLLLCHAWIFHLLTLPFQLVSGFACIGHLFVVIGSWYDLHKVKDS
jgi:hypothetical protein